MSFSSITRNASGLELETTLANGLAQLAVDCPVDIQQKLLVFLRLLGKWNRVYNLTAIRDLDRMVTYHLLDSLAVLPFIKGNRVLDVGAGAGLPGIPLALLLPGVDFVLLDSNAKKTRFMQQALIELNMKNSGIMNIRVEDLPPNYKFDTIISRAFASIEDMVAAVGRHCQSSGAILAMKGNYPSKEIKMLPEGYKIKAVHELSISGLEAQRHLVHIEPVSG